MEIAMKFAETSPQNGYSKPSASDFPAPVWRIFRFLRDYEIIFMDARDWSLPCFCFIHSFFKSKAKAKKKSSVRMLAFPQVKKRRNPPRSRSGGIQSRF